MAKSDKPDAIALLKADHRKVEELFAEFEGAKGDGKKRKLAEQICLELTVHTKIEEDIFYPACKGKIEEDLLGGGLCRARQRQGAHRRNRSRRSGRRILRRQGEGAL
ncbi:hemerythrin domain-containing protein [Phenylobacterium sp. J426]|uniref:hemerythrin domain-containing protein n=1 Tax=Phenylobacterium sp. J426 TaxID=2898439 RepID=UPI0035B11DB9